MPGTVLIEIRPGFSRVRSPFTAKDIIKAFPSHQRDWDQDSRCWLIATSVPAADPHASGEMALQ